VTVQENARARQREPHTCTHIHTHTHTHTYTNTHIHTHTHTLSHTQSLAYTLMLSFSLSFSLPHPQKPTSVPSSAALRTRSPERPRRPAARQMQAIRQKLLPFQQPSATTCHPPIVGIYTRLERSTSLFWRSTFSFSLSVF